MAKLVSWLLLAAMIVHLIRPLGLPGLRHRRDFWKIAVLALVIVGMTAFLSPNFG
jgi:hypothetical protein